MQLETQSASNRPELRVEAVKRLEKRREFASHFMMYALVNLVVWAVWGVIFLNTQVWFPWPLFVTFGWGIGVASHAWDVYARPITEEDIEREEARLLAR